MIFINALLFAQKPEYEYTLYELDDGLPDTQINDISIDSQGFIWLATSNGLSRFDGQGFTNFTNFDSSQYIRRNYIQSLFIGDNDVLYLGTDDGIDILDPYSGKLESIRPGKSEDQALVGNTVQAIYMDDRDRLWVATDRGYSYQYSDDLKHFEYKFPLFSPHQFHHNNHIVHDFVPYGDKIYSNASLSEIWSIQQNGELDDKMRALPTNNSSPSSPYKILFDSSGKLWSISLTNGLYYKTPDSRELVNHPISKTILDKWKTNIDIESDRYIWVTGINILLRLDIETGESIDYSDGLNQHFKDVQVKVLSMKIDPQSNIWIGTNVGLIKLSKKTSGFKNYFEGNALKAITTHDGKLYVGRYYSVDLLDIQTEEVSPFPLTNMVILGKDEFHIDPSALVIDGDKLWIRGKTSYDLSSQIYKERATESWFEYLHIIDHRGVGWIGGNGLIQNYMPDIDSFIPYQEPHKKLHPNINVTTLYEGRDSSIWIASNHGLYQIDVGLGVQEYYSFLSDDTLALPNDAAIYSMYEDKHQVLWLGTNGGGLHKIDLNSKEIENYSMKDGLPSNYIFGILPEGDSCLWMSTRNGLARLDKEIHFFSHYSQQDGLLSNIYERSSSLMTDDGRLYFGGTNGLDAFYPEDVLKQVNHNTSSKLKLTNFSYTKGKNNQQSKKIYDVDNLQNIEIEHHDKLIELEFALLDYRKPEGHAYSWRLEGFDDNWSAPMQSNMVSFTGLPPGKYTFQVRASTGAGQWIDQQISIPIKVKQAWYKTTWFFILSMILTSILIGLILQYRYYQKMMSAKKIETLKTKISSDLHDDVGSMLSGLSMQAQVLEHQAQGAQKEQLRQISEISRQAMETMRDTVWAIDSRQNSYTSLIDKMRDYAELNLSNSTMDYKFRVIGEISNSSILPNLRQQIYLIYKEAMSNAIKHSGASLININFTKSDSDIGLVIKDNGKSKHNNTSSGQGMANMLMRAQRVNGKLTIDQSDGYSVKLNIPISI